MALSFFKRLANKILNRPQLPQVDGVAPTATVPPTEAPSKIGALFGRLFGKRAKPQAQARPAAEPEAQGSGIPPELQDDWLLSGSWMNVSSSNVEKIKYAYDDLQLFIGFLSGSEYVYTDVPPEVALAMSKTQSPGRFVWRFLRDVYSYSRLVVGNKPTPRMSPRNKNVVRPRRELDPAATRRDFQVPGVRKLVSKWTPRHP